MWFGIDKVELSPGAVAALGISMVKASKCRCIGAQLSGLRREDTAVYMPKKKPR
jgi:hypothetical protein